MARLAGCKQGWISAVERGHLPRPWNRDRLLRAYRLDGNEADFVRMVTNAKRLRSLGVPIDDEFPLARYVEVEAGAVVRLKQPGLFEGARTA